MLGNGHLDLNVSPASDFDGFVVGLGLQPIILVKIFEAPLIAIADIKSIPEVIWFALGVTIVFLYRWLARVPMVPDTTRAGIDTLGEVLMRAKFSDTEERQYWRIVAHQISIEVSLKDGLILDYERIGETSAEEKPNASGGSPASRG